MRIEYGGNDSENGAPFWSNKFEVGNGDSKREILVISVPYRHGTHTTTSPTGFIPIIEQLDLLHKKGVVHGDIRAFNTVFVDDNEGWLIDFDFGGELTSNPTYPRGYKEVLEDGTRMGVEGKPIRKCDDWYVCSVVIDF